MKRILIYVLSGAATVSSSVAQASRKYGMAGCGLGSVVSGRSGNQISAATGNGLFWSKYFGISFGTMNCTPEVPQRAEVERQEFYDSAAQRQSSIDTEPDEPDEVSPRTKVTLVQQKKKTERLKKVIRQPQYGMAGCGTGTLVYNAEKETSKQKQLLIAGFNDFTFLSSSAGLYVGVSSVALPLPPYVIIPVGPTSAQSSWVASGASNCTESATESTVAQAERQNFLDVNFNSLSRQAAQGEGSHLRSFSAVLGCRSDEQFRTFARLSQSTHSYIFSDSVPENVLNRWSGVSESDEILAGCIASNYLE